MAKPRTLITKPRGMPMTERIPAVIDRMVRLDQPLTVFDISDGMILTPTGVLSTLLLMERRGLAERAGTTEQNAQLWRLTP